MVRMSGHSFSVLQPLKDNGKDYKKYDEYAVSKAPNNKVYQSLL